MDEQAGKFPAIWSEEGKYLASVLGDALVRGLTQVSQERPNDPVQFLADYLREYHGSQGPSPAPVMTAGAMESGSPSLSAKEAELQQSFEKSNSIDGMNDNTPLLDPLEPLPPFGDDDESDASDEDGEEMLRRLDDEVPEIPDREEEEAEERNYQEQQQMRDERGQSVLHFTASRPGGAQTIYSFLQNPSVNLAWRDENLKTCRDVAFDFGRVENVVGIDSYVISLVSQGQLEQLEKLMLDGYDHINDISDGSKLSIFDIAADKPVILEFLNSVNDFGEKLKRLHHSIRMGSLEQVKELVRDDSRLASALSPYGRTSLHVAVLVEQHSIAQLLAQEFPEALKRGDHLDRTPLHYAMGVEKVEKMTRILVRAGAKRVVKDLRGRQPSYYFINREEIALLQEQEVALLHEQES